MKRNSRILRLVVLVIGCSLLMLPLGLVNAADTVSTAAGLISDLKVNDTARANYWSIKSGLKVGDVIFGDRSFAIVTLPAAYAGSTWISTAADSKKCAEKVLVTFKVTKDATVLVAFDDRVLSGMKPGWLAGWVDTNDNITDDGSTQVTYSLLKKSFPANSIVELGPNTESGTSGGCIDYFVIVK
jgi:hypothetical protein